MYETILLPTDGSEASKAATDHAATLAAAFDATVHVLSVVDTRNRFESPSNGLAAEAWAESERNRAETAVETAAGTLPETVAVEQVVRAGVPHATILEYVDEGGVDAIVMGTHGRTGLDHYLVGSVTERVVRSASVPVLTVRAAESGEKND